MAWPNIESFSGSFQNISQRERGSLSCLVTKVVRRWPRAPNHYVPPCFLPQTLHSAVGKEAEREERQRKRTSDGVSVSGSKLIMWTNESSLFAEASVRRAFVTCSQTLLVRSWPRKHTCYQLLRVVFSSSPHPWLRRNINLIIRKVKWLTK